MDTTNKARRDFFHHLHDTLILLGAGQRFSNLVESPEKITAQDVDDLRSYNGRMIDLLKSKLVDINKIAITPVGDDCDGS